MNPEKRIFWGGLLYTLAGVEPLADTWSQEAADFFLQRAQAGRLAATVLAYEPSQPLVVQVKVKSERIVQIRDVARLKSLQNLGASRELCWLLLTKMEKFCAI